MNRKERRRHEAMARKATPPVKWSPQKARKEIDAPGYSAANDPEFQKGVAEIVRHIDFGDGIGGLCLFRALAGYAAIASCDLKPVLHIGSLLCRVGPDPMRDVVAFCGPGNAGYESAEGFKAYHAWVELDDMIADFSVGDWRGINPSVVERIMGLPDVGAIQWDISLPRHWWRPRSELIGAWQAAGTPALGEAWYGPYDSDAANIMRVVQAVADDVGPQIAQAIERMKVEFGRQHGLLHEPREPSFPELITLVEMVKPAEPPPGWSKMMLSEILALAGASLGDVPDAAAYVPRRPTTREQALNLLRNMTVAAPR
jgi:hypothetical protein